jgi:hypothetical protein
VVLPGQGGYAEPGQFIDGRRCLRRVSGGVPDHELEWPSAGVVSFANGQLESGEQVPSRLDPAGPGQRNEDTDPDG